jgi:branched-subunit amino acid aminotransferase/4-amino-4-deoxychorismate lyase
MRAQILQHCQQTGIHVKETQLTLADLPRARAAFWTNAVRGVVPIHQIDDWTWGTVTQAVALLSNRSFARLMALMAFGHPA